MKNFSQKRLLRLENLLDSFVNNGLVGCSILVSKENIEQLYYHTGSKDIENNRDVERDDIYRIYSMTKSIVCFGMMILLEKGKVYLDDDISKFIPELENLEVYKSGNINSTTLEKLNTKITIRHLMTHQAGFTYGSDLTPVHQMVQNNLQMDPKSPGLWRNSINSAMDSDEVIQQLSNIPLYYQPGKNWHYSIAIDILGIVIERISGKNLEQFLKENIFNPLNMYDTEFSIKEDKINRFASLYSKLESGHKLLDSSVTSGFKEKPKFYSGGGGLVSTIDDYMKYLKLLIDKGNHNGEPIIGSNTVELFMSIQTGSLSLSTLQKDQTLALESNLNGIGHALGGAFVMNPQESNFYFSPRGEFFWSGYAFTHFWIDPNEKISVVFMTQMADLFNTEFGNSIVKDLRTIIYTSLM